MLLRSFLLPLCASGVVALNTHAQVVLKAQPVEEVSSENPAKAAKPAAPSDLDASWKTQREARSLTLQVPAPRGQIVDRNGVPYAQNRVANYLALVMPYMEGAADDKIVAFAKQSVESANKLLGKSWSIPDDRVLSHYKHRRWLPLVFSSSNGINEEITPEMEKKLEPILGANLVLQSAYLRHYPQNERASHIIGYTGKSRPLPLGPIADGDPIFEEMEGRADVEKTFDSDLKGQPGIVNVLFGPVGKRLAEDVRRFPVPGPIAFGRGLEITLEVDELAFQGGSAFLFGAVMERFLARHVSLNSFTETVLRSGSRGEIMRWAPRLGAKAII